MDVESQGQSTLDIWQTAVLNQKMCSGEDVVCDIEHEQQELWVSPSAELNNSCDSEEECLPGLKTQVHHVPMYGKKAF